MPDALPPLTGQRAEVVRLWRALIEAGAMRNGIFAALDTWLRRQGYGVIHAELLTDRQAAEAVAKLERWLARVLSREARDG